MLLIGITCGITYSLLKVWLPLIPLEPIRDINAGIFEFFGHIVHHPQYRHRGTCRPQPSELWYNNTVT